MGALIRALDWQATPLGPIDRWPNSLKTLVRVMLHSRQPMILWWGPELIQLYNDAFRPSFGEGKHPRALGQRARECWPEVWPVVGQQLEDVLNKEVPAWHENVLVPIFRNGRVDDAWWNYSYSPAYGDEGLPAGIIIICTEITAGVRALSEVERAQREAELARVDLQDAFMQAPQPIAILTGPEHRFTLANAAYKRLVGREVLGKTLTEAFSESTIDQYRTILDNVFQTGVPFQLTEAELHLGSHEGPLPKRYIDVVYQAYRNSNGRTLGVIVVINDVSAPVLARRAIEEAALERTAQLAREQQLRSAAESAGRARDEFLAMLGHELRNPLAPISTAAQLMRMRGDHHAKEREIIERQVAHLSRLVDDLLDVTRVASGKIELQRSSVDLSEVILRAVEMVSPLLDRRAHNLQIDVPKGRLAVYGDPVRLAQVIANLIHNAAKFTPPLGRIEVQAARVAAAEGRGEEVSLTVADSGPGIPPELLPQIFDLFVQGQQGMDRARGGLGLGLALVKNLVALHDGRVSAANREEGGSRFTITLPAHADAAQPLPASESTTPTRERKDAVRVLVVDDNEDAAQMLELLLSTMGHEVVVAHDGPQALAALKTFPAQVGLFDLGLPGMDGLELARRVREEWRGSPLRLVALTGYGQKNDRERTKNAGFDLHLTKPVSMEDLEKAVEGERAELS